MTEKTATVTLEGDGLRFVARSGSGHTIVLDNTAGDSGMRPSELVPLALAGCGAMDVVSILRKKRQEFTGYEVRTSGTQQLDHPNAFTTITVTHVVDGPDIDEEAVRRAIELSATRYCSVGATLTGGTAEIHHGYLIRDTAGAERSGTVLRIAAGSFVRDTSVATA